MDIITKKHIKLADVSNLKNLLKKQSLNTVCESAKCPNIGECFHKGLATFLIAGYICTRNCAFCGVSKGIPQPLDKDEPRRVSDSIKELGLRYAVITSVTRDDLEDGSAGHFAETVRHIRQNCPKTLIELLVPDFRGNRTALDTAISAKPDVFAHNLETVPRLYPEVRKGADYRRSLELLSWAKCGGLTVKSGLMLGLGENEDEILEVMDDLISIGCDMLTLGQYMAPSKAHFGVKANISDRMFVRLKDIAVSKGFRHCASGRYVRSSYMAENSYRSTPGVSFNV